MTGWTAAAKLFIRTSRFPLMSLFPSREWADDFVRMLNSNEKYREAGRTWEGDVILAIEKDAGLQKSWFVYLDLHHGQCRKHEVFEEGETLPSSEFRYSGPYSNWQRLISGDIEPIQGLLTGKFKLKGPIMKVMRHSRAAREMVSTAKMVETRF